MTSATEAAPGRAVYGLYQPIGETIHLTLASSQCRVCSLSMFFLFHKDATNAAPAPGGVLTGRPEVGTFVTGWSYASSASKPAHCGLAMQEQEQPCRLGLGFGRIQDSRNREASVV